jgi:IclR family acetate operon transcriptional repressor
MNASDDPKAMNEKSGDGVRAVDRALEILMAFEAGAHSLSAGELLKRVDLSRPTLYRLLKTLEMRGFVTSSGEPQRFQLGPAVAHLSHVYTSGLDLVNTARPMMRALWESTGETVALLVQQGHERACIAEMPSAHYLSFKLGVGHREKITLGASGRAALAFSVDADRSLREMVSAKELPRYREALAQVRADGYSVSKDELIQGAVAIAAPFFTGRGVAGGSLAVYGPSARIDEQATRQILPLLLEQAAALSKACGGEPPAPPTR